MESFILQLQQMLDENRLRRAGFRGPHDFLERIGLRPKAVYEMLDRGHVPPRLTKAVAERIATPPERSRLRRLSAGYDYDRWLEQTTTSTTDLLNRARKSPADASRDSDRRYFERCAAMLAEKNGIEASRVSVDNIGTILTAEVLSARDDGRYRAAMMAGFVLFRWWQIRLARLSNKPSQEDLAAANALLVGLARATGQAENLALHWQLIRFARELHRLDTNSQPVHRAYISMASGWLENRWPGKVSAMRRILAIHENEIDISKKAMRWPEATVHFRDSLFAISETFFNRANIALRLETPPSVLASYLSELEDRSAQIEQMFFDRRGEDWRETGIDEPRLFRKILRARYYDKLGRDEKALECAADIIAEIEGMREQRPFLKGNAHLLYGNMLLCRSRKRHTTLLDEDVHRHQQIAIRCFEQVSNDRMRRKAERELMIPRRSGTDPAAIAPN